MADQTRYLTPDAFWGLLNQERAIRVWAVERALNVVDTSIKEALDCAALIESFVLGARSLPPHIAEEAPPLFNEYGLMKDLGDGDV